MNRLVYQYSIVRFAPFPETEEFANIGIVLVIPKLNALVFKVESLRKTRRVIDFFDLSNRKQLYKAAIEALRYELGYLKERVELDELSVGAVISSLARTKQSVLQYSSIRAGFTEKLPIELMDELFSRYVEFNTQVKEQNEYRLEKTIKGYLDDLNLSMPFRKQDIGSKDTFKVTFPFVRTNGSDVEVIKPLYLGQKDATKIFEHGDLLLSKLRRLRQLDLMPNHLLIPYQLGQVTQDSKVSNNQRQVIEDLGEFATVVSSKDQAALLDFVH